MNINTLATKVKPVNETHSIKEAVISLFLANQILKPERFNELIKTSLKEKFQLFEPIIQFQFEVKNPLATSATTPKPEVLNNIGFKFTSFYNGAPATVL